MSRFLPQRRLIALAACIPLSLAACGDSSLTGPEAEAESAGPMSAARGGRALTTATDPALAGAVFFLQPIAADAGEPAAFDASLTDVLTFSVCALEAGSCASTLAEFHATDEGAGRLRIDTDDAHYMAVWNQGRSRGSDVRITASIGALALASADMNGGNGAVPIKLRIENHPVIRTRAMRESGASATETAVVLAEEFGLDAEAILDLLFGDVDPYSPKEVGAALRIGLKKNAEETAKLFKKKEVPAEKTGEVLKEEYGYDVQKNVKAMYDAGYTERDVTDVAVDVYGATLEQTVDVLQNAGAKVERLIAATVEKFGASIENAEQKVVAALRTAGVSALIVAEGLRTGLEAGAVRVTELLRQSGFPVNDVTGALVSVFQLGPQNAPLVLQLGGYTAQQIGSVLGPVLGHSAQSAVLMLESLGFTAQEVMDAVRISYELGAETLAAYFRFTGFATSEIAAAFGTIFDMNPQSIADVLDGVGYTAGEIADALRASFGLGAQEVAQLLENAGATAAEIMNAMRDVYNLNAQTAAQVLRNLGFSAKVVAGALGNVYQAGANTVGVILANVGYTTNQVADVLRDVYGWSASQVTNFLDDTLGISQDDIENALAAAGYAAGEIRSAIEGIFGTVGGVFCGIFGC